MKHNQSLSRLFFMVMSCILFSTTAIQEVRAVSILTPASTPAPVFNQCSPDQKASLEQALQDAERLTRNAFLVLKETPKGQRENSTRYREWFGSYDPSNYATVMDHFQRIYEVLATQKITFNCGCTDLRYAYASLDHPYEITLCGSFWPAPSNGTNSRAGTLVHEISHFNHVAGTSDHVYSQIYGRLMAQYVPAKAIDNADSYRYYAENDPQLEPREPSGLFMISNTEIQTLPVLQTPLARVLRSLAEAGKL